MTQQTKSSMLGNIDINDIMNGSSKLHTNVSQNVVLTTEDKLEICLRKHQDTLNAKSEWKIPIGMIATLIPVLITAEFKNMFGLPAETWKALFIFTCIVTFGWSLKTIHKAIKHRNAGDIEKIINDIKKSSTE